MSSYVSTVGQYALLAAVAGAATYVYKPQLFEGLLQSSHSPQLDPASGATQTANKKKSKKPKVAQESKETGIEKGSVGNEQASKAHKKRKIISPVDVVTPASRSETETRQPKDTSETHDFAQQMAKARAGTTLQAKTKQNAPASSRLAATINSTPSQENLGTGEQPLQSGRVADDDISSVESPTQRPASGKDISDMLEAPSAGPISLRLTNVSVPKTQKQAAKQFEPVMSKKKRNEQARREEQKRINQESERLHEQKKQEQLRAARMAEGTSKQTRANNFTAQSKNVWQNRSSPSFTNGHGSSAPLLDTFDPSVTTEQFVQAQPESEISQTSVNGNAAAAVQAPQSVAATNTLAPSSRENRILAEQLSEEEQMERVRQQEQESAWESVQSKKAKKKAGRKENDTSSEASISAHDSQPVMSKQPQTNGIAAKPNTRDAVNRYASITVDTDGLANDEWGA